MKLREVLAGTDVVEVAGDADVEVRALSYRADTAEPGSLFFCVPGSRADGHEFAATAVRRGAVALVVERLLDLPVPQARVASSRAAMAEAAARFFGDPTGELRVVGVTGTNGKTTTTFLIRRILEASGIRTGLLGTVKRIVGGATEEVERTTPEAIDLQATFRRMLEAGDAACAMEVSSHALALERVECVRFAVAAFTNLSQDHLDFHGDMERYFAAKRLLFVEGRSEAAVVNVDDPYGARLAAELAEAKRPLLTFSADGAAADLRALDVAFDASGTRFRLRGPGEETEVAMPLPGHFNVENALAALAASHALGVPLADGARALAGAERVPGRFEPVEEGQPFSVIVDYAHTPDSLENVLAAARRITERRLIVVFGCGGDRDRQKRPRMGEIGARLADLAFVTSDNPRSEDPEAIIAEILAGVPSAEKVVVDADRRSAIARALAAAREGDTVVIAGKGHEQGQELAGGKRVPFDDAEVAREELERLAARAA